MAGNLGISNYCIKVQITDLNMLKQKKITNRLIAKINITKLSLYSMKDCRNYKSTNYVFLCKVLSQINNTVTTINGCDFVRSTIIALYF